MVRRRRVSIKDVAERAGVNRSTVSRAMSADPRISPATITKVLEAARRLGYVPHSGARALALGRTNIITAVVPSLRLAFPYQALRGIEAAIMKTSYRLRVEIAHEGLPGLGEDGAYGLPNLASTLEKVALGGEADGVILVAQSFPDEQIEHMYAMHQFPVVLLEGKSNWGGRVSLDNAAAGRLAAEHFLKRGRRHLAIVNGSRTIFRSYAERHRGFVQALHEAGAAPPLVLEDESVDLHILAAVAQRLRGQQPAVDGVFVAAGAIVETASVVARGAIIDVGAVGDHDCRIGEFSHVRAGTVCAPGTIVPAMPSPASAITTQVSR